jgi:DNA-binding NtrC family response regulator
VITPEDLEMGPRPAHATLALDLPDLVRSGAGLASVLDEVRRALVAEALLQADGDPAEAARRLAVRPDELTPS